MKRIRQGSRFVFSFVLSMVLILSMAMVTVHATTIANGNGWTLDSNGVLTITKDIPTSENYTYEWATHASDIKEVFIGEGVIALPDMAFSSVDGVMYNQLTTVTFSSTVETVGNGVFMETKSLTQVNINAGAKRIGSSAFSGTSLTSLTLPNGAELGADCFYGTKISTLVVPGNSVFKGNAQFMDCDQLTNVVVQEGVKELGNECFQGCPLLMNARLPYSLTTINGDVNESPFDTIGMCIQGYPGSEAQTYVSSSAGLEYKFKFDAVGATQPILYTSCVSYRTHVQTYGWQGYVSNGQTSGTTGQSKRLEAINIQLTNTGITGGITYRTHVQTYGWQDWKADNEISGTSGQSKRLEAIEIKLTGDVANYYDIYYRVHAQQFGWLDWASNGASAGTAGYSYRLEGIQIVLVKKGERAPGETKKPYVQKYIKYNTHVQTYGWQGDVYDGTTSGTVGQSKRLEGIHISLDNPRYSGSIQYKTHVQTYGWQNWVSSGQMAGTTGQSKRLEAIQIQLIGDMANHYDIYYRVHVQQFGWLGWAENGTSAGSAGYSYRLEGIQIILVNKGGSAPGNTSDCFRQR